MPDVRFQIFLAVTQGMAATLTTEGFTGATPPELAEEVLKYTLALEKVWERMEATRAPRSV